MLIKKILISVSMVLFCLLLSNTVFASESTDWDEMVKVKISSDFSIFLPKSENGEWGYCSKEQNGDTVAYYCMVPKWVSGIEIIMGNMIRFFTYIASLAAVLFLVIGGIMYSMAWLDQWAKDNAKKMIVMVLSWLVLLLLSGVVLRALAPWVYT